MVKWFRFTLSGPDTSSRLERRVSSVAFAPISSTLVLGGEWVGKNVKFKARKVCLYFENRQTYLHVSGFRLKGGQVIFFFTKISLETFTRSGTLYQVRLRPNI